MPGLRALVVDDERPVLDELVFLLSRDERVEDVRGAQSGAEALRLIERGDVDVVFLDIAMPGLSGLDIARLLGRFRETPSVVFVTAHDEHAVDAFELDAVDYLLKPIREERLSESVRRVQQAGSERPAGDDAQVAVELGGVTRFVARAQVAYLEAQGDYVRLHLLDGSSHLLRTPLTTLAEQWADAGFARVHRSHLVALDHVREVRSQGGRTSVLVPSGERLAEVVVARRLVKDLRARLQERTS